MTPNQLGKEGVLVTGVYGAGKSTIAAEICYLLEQRRQPYALLDLDFLGWGIAGYDGDATGSPFMLRNLAAVVSNYREAGISVFVMAYFVAGHDELRGIREAVGVPLRVVRLTVPLPEIQQRLSADMTTERQEEALEAGRQIAAGEGVGVEDMVLANDRPVPVVAQQVMTWLGWLGRPARLGQRRDDQVIGVAEQVGHHLVRQRAIEGDRVPVPLVQVIARRDGWMGGPQLDRELRVAFDAQLQRLSVQAGQGEHLPADLEHRHLVAERELLLGTRQRQARCLELVLIHHRNRSIATERT